MIHHTIPKPHVNNVIRFPSERARRSVKDDDWQVIRPSGRPPRCEAYVFRQPGDHSEHRCKRDGWVRFRGEVLCRQHAEIRYDESGGGLA